MRVHEDLNNLPSFRNAVITIGSFDGVHLGHCEILDRLQVLAQRCGGESVVITFHPHPRQIIYPKDNSLRLLTSIEEKTELLLNNGIDHVVVVPFTVQFSQLSADEYIERFLVEKFHPHTIVIGYDHHFGLNRQGDINFLRWHAEKFNYRVVEIAQQTVEDIGISSTKIRKALQIGQLKQALKWLGHSYVLSGKVIRGQQIGSSIGFPTANLEPLERNKLIPADGIYAVSVQIKDRLYGGMLYIGQRPTLPSLNNRTIEVNIFDFNEDIYGENIQLQFIAHLREDTTFSDLEGLKTQLAEDRRAALAALSQYQKPAERKKKMRSAIVVLNYNGVDYLRQFLPTLIDCT
ncbi:MAG: bifunctional riboflavin kinase/FAD synthetase, partial [Bacteroidota bacterium]